MEPTKRDGMIREQINLEDKIRREYDKKWGQLTRGSVNEFYNPNYLSQQFRARWKKDTEKWPYVYDKDGAGECRFVSEDIYNELLAKCRCGRPRTEAHLLNCLQKAKQGHNLLHHQELLHHKRANEIECKGEIRNDSPGGESSVAGTSSIPVTSSGVIGWPQHRYLDLERSTYYVSPKNSIPGGRIDDKPYSNIFIG